MSSAPGRGGESRPPRIGSCPACGQRARLDDDYCAACLTTPRRGRRWAHTAAHIRRNPVLQREVYSVLDSARAEFVRLFGPPPEQEPQAVESRPRLVIVRSEE